MLDYKKIENHIIILDVCGFSVGFKTLSKNTFIDAIKQISEYARTYMTYQTQKIMFAHWICEGEQSIYWLRNTKTILNWEQNPLRQGCQMVYFQT
jgi:hypothetical protein